MDFRDAGAALLAALAAMAAADALEITSEDPVLIIGASGGVGTFAVQLAKRAGAKVIAPGLAEDEDFLRSLDADHLIDRDGHIASALREIEPGGATALIDIVSMAPEDLDANAAMVADGGGPLPPTAPPGMVQAARTSWAPPTRRPLRAGRPPRRRQSQGSYPADLPARDGTRCPPRPFG